MSGKTGRQAIYDLVEGKVSWPPVVVPFGLDPFGWHGRRESYREICNFALGKCTLLPKVFPVANSLCIGKGIIEKNNKQVRKYELLGAKKLLSMEKVQNPGDSSWHVRTRWIENEDDFETFLGLKNLPPLEPDIEAVRAKEKQIGEYGLPYAEISDPFGIVSEMFPTETFYIKILNDTERIMKLLFQTGQRVVDCIEALCRGTGCPFILRLIGAEMAVPPFLSRDKFLSFEGEFYRRVAEIAGKYNILTAFHCHGPLREIMADIWSMGYNFIEPFEPPPRGNVSIAEALTAAEGRGIVFGGIDDVLLANGSPEDVRIVVRDCLDDARPTGKPFILSQSATPFYDPLPERAKENLLLFMELGTLG
ncbi:MAG: hypothetical protein FVQ80_14220 [Planctomycetes bacterium]|nr:hypothetical protein [Planctomycetota bacterium]